MRKPLLLTCVVLGASGAAAQAVGFRTQMSCASDYYAYCSQHAPGSPGVRKCMRAVGPKLSKACINALIADGEVSKAEVEAQKQKLAGAKAKPKAAEPKNDDVAATSRKAQPDTKKDVKKTDVAQKKPAPAEAKSGASKVAAAAMASKPKAAVRAAAPAVAAVTAPDVPPSAEAERQTVSLDQATFEALKNRGAVFVAEDGGATDTARTEVEPTIALPDAGTADAETVQAPVGRHQEESTAAESLPVDSRTQEAIAEVSDDAVQPPAEYPPGRMSLGRKLSSATGETKPSSWWDQLVEAVTGE